MSTIPDISNQVLANAPDPNVNLKVMNVAKSVQVETTIELLNDTIKLLGSPRIFDALA